MLKLKKSFFVLVIIVTLLMVAGCGGGSNGGGSTTLPVTLVGNWSGYGNADYVIYNKDGSVHRDLRLLNPSDPRQLLVLQIENDGTVYQNSQFALITINAKMYTDGTFSGRLDFYDPETVIEDIPVKGILNPSGNSGVVNLKILKQGTSGSLPSDWVETVISVTKS